MVYTCIVHIQHPIKNTAKSESKRSNGDAFERAATTQHASMHVKRAARHNAIDRQRRRVEQQQIGIAADRHTTFARQAEEARHVARAALQRLLERYVALLHGCDERVVQRRHRRHAQAQQRAALVKLWQTALRIARHCNLLFRCEQ
jgi:hypothetical protein